MTSNKDQRAIIHLLVTLLSQRISVERTTSIGVLRNTNIVSGVCRQLVPPNPLPMARKCSRALANVEAKPGFVIYRCTYASDAEWDECIRIIRDAVGSILEFYGGLDLLDGNPFTIFEDRNVFENAPAAIIRDHFDSWVDSACLQEQSTSHSLDPLVGSPRYRFCVQINEENLRSILDDKRDADMNAGQIRLIRRTWSTNDDDDRESASDPINLRKKYEDVEGCTAYDVGWVNIRQNEYLTFYCRFQGREFWQARYARPPLTAMADGI